MISIRRTLIAPGNRETPHPLVIALVALVVFAVLEFGAYWFLDTLLRGGFSAGGFDGQPTSSGLYP